MICHIYNKYNIKFDNLCLFIKVILDICTTIRLDTLNDGTVGYCISYDISHFPWAYKSFIRECFFVITLLVASLIG